MGVLKTWDKSKQEWVATATAVPTFDADLPGVLMEDSDGLASLTGQSIGMDYDTTLHDPYGYWDVAQKGFVVPAGMGGQYVIGMSGTWDAGASSNTAEMLVVNGVWVTGEVKATGAQTGHANIWYHTLADGDLVQHRLNTNVTRSYATNYTYGRAQFWMSRLAGAKGEKGEQGTAGADAPDTYDALTDTDMTGLIADDVPRWDGTEWRPGKAADPSGSTSLAWPVGSVFLTVDDGDPSTLLGFGTWARIGEGKVLFGRDPGGDADFDTTEETGGDKTHNHGSHSHSDGSLVADANTSHRVVRNDVITDNVATNIHTHTISGSTGSTTPASDSHVPPYLVVNMWKRTA